MKQVPQNIFVTFNDIEICTLLCIDCESYAYPVVSTGDVQLGHSYHHSHIDQSARSSRHFVLLRDVEGRVRFACRKCGRGFQQQCNLLRHRKQCEGDFHLQCHICYKLFYRRDKYQGHLLTKHGIHDSKKGTFKKIT